MRSEIEENLLKKVQGLPKKFKKKKKRTRSHEVSKWTSDSLFAFTYWFL